jgi:hypothetical protein
MGVRVMLKTCICWCGYAGLEAQGVGAGATCSTLHRHQPWMQVHIMLRSRMHWTRMHLSHQEDGSRRYQETTSQKGQHAQDHRRPADAHTCLCSCRASVPAQTIQPSTTAAALAAAAAKGCWHPLPPPLLLQLEPPLLLRLELLLLRCLPSYPSLLSLPPWRAWP